MTDEAYWTNDGGTGYPRLDGRGRADVAVIGGAAAGLWTAWELARTGRRVAVLEAGRIADAAKGAGAGQASVVQALAYTRIAHAVGADAAHSYAQAQKQAIERIAEVADRLGVDCDLERCPAYIYAPDEQSLPQLHEEWAAAVQADIPAVYDAAAGLPFAVAGALHVVDQIQFHPGKLLAALAEDLVRRGSAVYEHSRVVTVDEGEPCVVMTEGGASVAAEQVVVATGFPIVANPELRRALRPRRELLLAGPMPAERAPEGMYVGVGESAVTIRTAPLDDGRRMVVVAGERYEAGSGSVEERFRRLSAWAAGHVGLDRVEFRWSAQDYATDDGLPVIGRVSVAAPGAAEPVALAGSTGPAPSHLPPSHPVPAPPPPPSVEQGRVWIATGFGGWDATNGALAGRLVSAGIRGERLPAWAAPFAPQRLEKNGHGQGDWSGPARSVVRHRVEPDERDALDAIRPGHGAVVDVGGEHCAAYRDASGLLHLVSALCPHQGCTVGFNDAEKTWECPCHGSRFTTDGALLQGPAAEPLAPARAYLALAAAE